LKEEKIVLTRKFGGGGAGSFFHETSFGRAKTIGILMGYTEG